MLLFKSLFVLFATRTPDALGNIQIIGHYPSPPSLWPGRELRKYHYATQANPYYQGSSSRSDQFCFASSLVAPLPCGRKDHGGEMRVALHCVELLNADYSVFKVPRDFYPFTYLVWMENMQVVKIFLKFIEKYF